MTTRILVPITHSTESEKALAHALSNFPDAEITVLHVINPSYHCGMEGYISYEQIMEGEERKAEQLFETAREIAKTHNAMITTERLVGHTSRTIVDYVEDNQFDRRICRAVDGTHSGVMRPTGATARCAQPGQPQIN